MSFRIDNTFFFWCQLGLSENVAVTMASHGHPESSHSFVNYDRRFGYDQDDCIQPILLGGVSAINLVCIYSECNMSVLRT